MRLTNPIRNSMKKLFVICVMLFSSISAFADSPITSTDFAEAYKDVPIVAEMLALNGEVVTEDLIQYIADDNNPIDVKVAAINAVCFTQDIYTPFMNYLKAKYGTESEIAVLSTVNASTAGALAYARARYYYMDLSEAYLLCNIAYMKEPSSFTINMIYALIVATDVMDYSFCDVYKACNYVLSDTTLNQDIRILAISKIMEYINLYKDDCNE